MTAFLLATLVGSVFFVGGMLALSAPATSVARRVAAHVEPREAAATRSGGVRRRVARALAATEERLGGTAAWRRLAELVERADIRLDPAEVLYGALGTASSLALIVLASGGSGARAVVAFVFVLLATRLYLGLKGARRVRRFEEQFPEVLAATASALRAGHSFVQALQAIADEAAEPARTELRRALAETRLGRSLDDALGDVGRRVASKDVEFVLAAISMQRQVGGSLAPLFEIVAETVRQRQQFSRRVRALTATGRMSAFVLIALPIVAAAALTALNREYMAPLYHTGTGQTMLAIASMSIVVGALILRRIVTFRG